MPRHRTFDMGRPPGPDDAVTFELTGRYTTEPDREPWRESFTCYGMAPAGVLESLTTTISLTPDGRRRYNALSCMEFVQAVLVPEDRDRFRALAEDPERMVGLIDLVSVVAWLSDELTLRPTPPSSGSTPGGGQLDGAATPVGAAP